MPTKKASLVSSWKSSNNSLGSGNKPKGGMVEEDTIAYRSLTSNFTHENTPFNGTFVSLTPSMTETGAIGTLSKTSQNCKMPFSKTPIKRNRIETSSGLFTPHPTSGLGTSSINISSATPLIETSFILVALIEGRGHATGEIGLASYDLKSPVLNLYQFHDAQTYMKLITKLNILNPMEVILPSTICEAGKSSKLFQQISENCFNLKVTSVNRKYFNDQKGLQYIKKLCLPDNSSIEFQVNSKYYCLAATNALLKYTECIENMDFAPASLKIVFKGGDQTAVLDYSTVKNMELIKNTFKSNSPYSLYGTFNNTQTHMGARLLKSNILQPLCDMSTINGRLDMVEEFLESSNLYHKVRYAVAKFLDTDHLLSVLIRIPKIETLKTAENKLTLLIHLKDTLEAVDTLKDAIESSRCDLLRSFYEILCDDRLDMMLQKILSVIEGNTHFTKGALAIRIQKGFAIKSKVNGLLDISRRTYSEAVDDINQLVKQLSEKYNMMLKSGYSASRGFYLHTAASGKKMNELPTEFLKPVKCKNSLIFTTYELMSFNEHVKDSLNEIYLLSGKVAEALMGEIRGHISCLHKLTECVAILDMISCFAYNCINSSSTYVRPGFSNTLAVKNGRHPILEKMHPGSTVPNTIYASDCCNFITIGGPNMSGKSTYLSQVVLMQIMAQIGSFIPAEEASFRITEQIFTRMGADMDAGADISNFMSEMKEINYILQNASSSSLIVIDELGRGTSAEEGIAICHAICEHLMKTNAFTFFATHYKQLMFTSELYSNVENYHFGVSPMKYDKEDIDHIDYTHVLIKGKMVDFHYGVHLAKISTLPQNLTTEAKRICEIIENHRKEYCELTEESRRKLVLFKVYRELETVLRSGSNLEERQLKASLVSLKANCVLE